MPGSIDLLPCPFCGSDKTEIITDIEDGWTVYGAWCSQCCASTGRRFADADEAAKSWNRREVARRLRAFSEKLGYISIPYLASAIGAENSDPKSLYDRLADLIEPTPTSSDTAPTCDRDALLALADEMESEGLEGWASGPVNVGEFVRRIREAVGA